MFKGQKGITLIALVITIIVLLILAGVSIMMLAGADNAPEKASEAVVRDAIGGAKDAMNFAASNAVLDYYNQKYVNSAAESSATGDNIQQIVYNAANGATIDENKLERTGNKQEGNETYTITVKYKDTSYATTATVDAKGGISWSGITGLDAAE